MEQAEQILMMFVLIMMAAGSVALGAYIGSFFK